MTAALGNPPPLKVFELLRVLAEHGLEFIAIGGFCVAAHGYERATKDLDILPNPDPSNLVRLLDALRSLEAEPLEVGDFRPEELPAPLDHEGLIGGGNWTLRTRYGRLDLMQYIQGIVESAEDYRALRERAIALALPDVGDVWFAGYEDLIAMKRAAGRDQDLIDIRSLEEARNER